MKKRGFVTLLGCAAAAAQFAVSAQQATLPVIGILVPGSPWAGFLPGTHPEGHDVVHQGMREAGYVDGQNVLMEYRFAEGHYDRLPALAADLVARKVDVILTNGTPGAMAAKQATSTIPIVFTSVGDPVGSGLVASLAHPGGNLTGFSNFNVTLAPKVLELISDLVPNVRTIALLVNQHNPYSELVVRSVRDAASTKGVELSVLRATTESEIDASFATLVQLRADALVVEGDPFFSNRREQIVSLAFRFAVPAIYLHLFFATAGGLIVYGVDETETGTSRESSGYVARILKGAKPADLPVQLPATFRLVINLKTAKALGLSVPPSIIVRADEVIE
jgi:putative ABC transport system substrate-binding protein